ncbi:MAG: hypothetical protein VKO39_03690 [Cyanobacteriota bacterium]|nr:hypothetical protein [Cyanobacteriota bacterium]
MDTFLPSLYTAHSELILKMMNIVLFGSNNPTGAAFLKICALNAHETWGRRPSNNPEIPHIYCDLSRLPETSVRKIRGILVSFAPIWLLAPFLMHLCKTQPEVLTDLKGIIACSSSSFLTKRFAFNAYDQKLSTSLVEAHELLGDISSQLKIPCQILAPTMIYGQVGEYADRNISKIISLLRRLPFILLPKTTGLRQPIHASQLASVAMHQAEKMINSHWGNDQPPILALGGDMSIHYTDMIIAIKNNLPSDDPGKKCRIITLPDRLFFMIAAPLLPLNSKIFEAVLRIKSNLSGFVFANRVLNMPPEIFPILPLASTSRK